MADKASDWLWVWVDENINAPGYDEDKSNFERDAKDLLAQAEADGINPSDIIDAAGGDLAQFLLDRQNSLTDAHIRRLAAKDD